MNRNKESLQAATRCYSRAGYLSGEDEDTRWKNRTHLSNYNNNNRGLHCRRDTRATLMMTVTRRRLTESMMMQLSRATRNVTRCCISSPRCDESSPQRSDAHSLHLQSLQSVVNEGLLKPGTIVLTISKREQRLHIYQKGCSCALSRTTI